MSKEHLNIYQRLVSRWKFSILQRSLNVLSAKDKKKITYISFLQLVLGILDLIGIGLIGVLGALAVTGVQSGKPGGKVSSVLKILNLQDSSFQMQVALLGLVATLVLVIRTAFSVWFTMKTLRFLSLRGAQISAKLTARLLEQSLLVIQERSVQKTVHSLTYGVSAIVIGVVATAVNLFADTALLLIIGVGLFIFDPVIAVSSFLFFAALGLTLNHMMGARAQTLGVRNTSLTVASQSKIIEVLNSYRESIVRNRRNYYSIEIGKQRAELAKTESSIGILPNISKYVIETSVVIGSLMISATQFVLQDAGHAVGTLAVFMAAGTRIAPAVLRMQQGVILIKGSAGTSEDTLKMIENFGFLDEQEKPIERIQLEHDNFIPQVSLRDISFKYPESSDYNLKNISVDIQASSITAIVGPSGAGKTTLVDMILGVLQPLSGTVEISGKTPHDAIHQWPGAISYVPQDVALVNGTIKENVGLGYGVEDQDSERVRECLDKAALGNFIEQLPEKIETQIGENGSKISGGQRQRIGIARALFTNPKLIVLDEATSAMDGETEDQITRSILNLKGKATVIVIAHRLSSVRNADQVIYMAGGQILAVGKFDEVRKSVPNFDEQAKLMGL